MTELFDRLTAALADRYAIERELRQVAWRRRHHRGCSALSAGPPALLHQSDFRDRFLDIALTRAILPHAVAANEPSSTNGCLSFSHHKSTAGEPNVSH